MEEKVDKINRIKNLHFAVIGKFIYKWTNLEKLRKIVLQQCDIKGDCKIGLFRNKHVFIHLT